MKPLIGILLFPLSGALAISLGLHLANWNFLEQHQFLLAAGFIAYLVLHFVFYKPIFAYVVSHEFTHAFWAWFLGREIGEVKIRQEGGHVMVGGSNAFISLVPYFFPFYTAMALIVMHIAKPAAVPYVMLVLGMTLSFHLVLTITMLARPQSDLQGTGYIFGFSVIVLMNILVMAGLCMWLFPSLMTPRSFVSTTGATFFDWGENFWRFLTSQF